MKKRLAISLVSAVLLISSCGQQVSKESQTDAPKEEISGQLIPYQNNYLAEGYKKLSDQAFIREDSEGGISYITEGEAGETEIVKYLNNMKAEAESRLLTIKEQGNNNQELEDIKRKITTIDSSLASILHAPEFPEIDTEKINEESQKLRPLQSNCFIANATATASGVKGSYAYAKAGVGIGDLACYQSAWQVTARYPDAGNSAAFTNTMLGSTCSGNSCPDISGQIYGYPSSGACNSTAFARVKPYSYSQNITKSGAFTC